MVCLAFLVSTSSRLKCRGSSVVPDLEGMIEPACQARVMSAAVAAASDNHAGVSLASIRNLAVVMIRGYDLFL